jgi:formylglycine-generating enzyme required for sulfatase activity/dienelactone hydrolase
MVASDIERLTRALAGRYRVDRELGRGGMAAVYLAQDLRHSRDVAIKVLLPALTASLGPDRFLREIAVTARLNHPHIVPLLDSGESDGFLYYVMPFIEGESLRDRLDRERQLPVRDALVITREVADALHHAHELGIIHRDVKPGNILLAGGHARLADFGIARIAAAIHGADASALTETGVIIGTTVYMSPEQAAGEASDRRTDIYSLAAVAYEMLDGRPPHTGVTADAILARKLREPVPSLTIVREAVSPEVDAAIRRALARVPADRFSTAGQFAEALAGGEAAAPPTSAAPTTRVARVSGARTAAIAVVAALGGAALFWFLGRDADASWLANEALPAIERHLDLADFESAYVLANEVRRRLPDSPELAEVWPRLSWRVTIRSEPSSAQVFRQAYGADERDWEALGRTPLTDIRFPFGLSRLRFELDGHRPLVRAIGGAHLNWDELAPGNPDALLVGPETFTLDTDDTLPADKVRVPGWTFPADGQMVEVRDFLFGRHEVTNAEYKAFVAAGGYERPDFWEPVVEGGRTLPWEEARRRFVDRTTRAGPSTWEAGDYHEGDGDLPVSGVSWYEASAYARFVGQDLPTARHWQEALANSMFPWLLPASNFSGQGPRPVTGSRAMTHVGAFDLTGNVREWTSSAIGDERVILGGSWNDPYYIASTTDTSAPPIDRSAGNGIRLAILRDEPAVAARLRAPLTRSTVSSASLSDPVSDDVYGAYARVFDYGRGPLNPSIEDVERNRIWIRERILFDAGYGSERVPLYLYLPASGTPPYQTIVYWPGWDTFALDDIDEYFAKQLDFVVKSGRAVAFPVYKGTFERRVGGARQRPAFNTAEYRDSTIDGVKDLRRTLDYLETRTDIDNRALGFFGYSWGGVNGPIVLAQEPRLRAAVIDIGLLPPMSATPEVDPVNALPRVRQPTLLLSGEFDPMVPMINARRYFALLGTAREAKDHVVAIGGHFIPRELLIREVLDWYDTHLGQPRR